MSECGHYGCSQPADTLVYRGTVLNQPVVQDLCTFHACPVLPPGTGVPAEHPSVLPGPPVPGQRGDATSNVPASTVGKRSASEPNLQGDG